jgi:hypothetical protein
MPYVDQTTINRSKDEGTTQASCGFRICGALVQNSTAGELWRVDRHWGKQLDRDNIHQVFIKFANNGEVGSFSAIKSNSRLAFTDMMQLACYGYRADVLPFTHRYAPPFMNRLMHPPCRQWCLWNAVEFLHGILCLVMGLAIESICFVDRRAVRQRVALFVLLLIAVL